MESSDGNKRDMLSAENIDKDGMWHVDGGKVDLRHVELHLPDGRGDEKVMAVVLSTEGYIRRCPECNKVPHEHDSLAIIMENWFYIVAKCCDTMLLYKKEEPKVIQWT